MEAVVTVDITTTAVIVETVGTIEDFNTISEVLKLWNKFHLFVVT